MSDASVRWRRVEELCHAALQRDASDRASFLAAACGDDAALRREVETLLAHAQTADGFLETPVGAAAAQVMSDAAPESWVGRRIGAYEIVSPLGAGGMGEVYRARDTQAWARRRDQGAAARPSPPIVNVCRGSSAKHACSPH